MKISLFPSDTNTNYYCRNTQSIVYNTALSKHVRVVMFESLARGSCITSQNVQISRSTAFCRNFIELCFLIEEVTNYVCIMRIVNIVVHE